MKAQQLLAATAILGLLSSCTERTTAKGPAADRFHDPDKACLSPVQYDYIVLFPDNGVTPTPAGQAELARAIRDAQHLLSQGQQFIVKVSGHADRSGPEGYNMRLAKRRADAVRDAFVAIGVPRKSIVTGSRGESESAVPTPDGVKEQGNRRVEIYFEFQ